MTQYKAQLIAASALAVVIILGLMLGVLYTPLSGVRPGPPISLSIGSGIGNCSVSYPPVPFTNSSYESQFVVLLMNTSSTATLCVNYYALQPSSLPISNSLQPSVWLAQSGSSTSEMTRTSTASTNTPTLVSAPGVAESANPNALGLTASRTNEFISYTVTAVNSSTGFYLLETPMFCPSLLPLAIGYSSSKVNSLDFQQYLSSSLSTSYGCSSSNSESVGESIMGETGFSIVYASVNGGANDTYSTLNSTSGQASPSSPSTGVNYLIHIGNVSALTPGSIFVSTTTQYITVKEESLGPPVQCTCWQGWSVGLTANASLTPGTYVITIGYEHNGTVYAKQQYDLQYSG